MKKQILTLLYSLTALVAGAQKYYDANGAYFGPTYEETNYSGAYYTGDYTSPFKTYLGKTDEEIQAKLDQLWNHYFKGSDNQKLYYDNGQEAYILDPNNNDVRSEGMSYSMMICVQTDHKTEFDKLWRWAKNHMWNKNGNYDGYFIWHCSKDGNPFNDNCNNPDGDIYIAMALLFAAHRWSNESYMEDAQYILKRMWKNGQGSLFNTAQSIVVYRPYDGYDFTCPAYSLPAFFDLFAHWSNTDQSKFAKLVMQTRSFLSKASHRTSGLFADCANFDGTPKIVYYLDNSDRYMYEAMRCAMNFGMDYYLFGKDAKQQEGMAQRLIDFFEGNGYKNARFTWDGTNGMQSYTPGEAACNAVACYALMNKEDYKDKIITNLTKAWEASLGTGTYRYYDGIVHYLAMLHLCGSFKIWKPYSPPADVNKDGAVDSADIVAVIKEMPDGDMIADVNGDGVIDSADIVAVIKAMK